MDLTSTNHETSSESLPAETLRLLGQSLDISESPFILYGKDYTIIYANAAARDYWSVLISGLETGLSIWDAMEKQTRVLSPEISDSDVDKVVKRIIDRFDQSAPAELYGEGDRFCRITHHKIGGNIIGMGVDITDLKAKEVELQKARIAEKNSNLAKSEFLANMSHEIRTPMNGIMGMAQLLANGDLNPRETEFVNVIERSGQALLTIINDILDFSKIEAGRIEFDNAPFLLRESIEDVTTLLSTAVADTGIDLLLRVQPDLPTTYMSDVGRFRQILTNIVGNAVKFTHEGHVLVDVTGVVQPDTVDMTIEISDTGIGIPPDKLTHIFDKFSQVDSSTTRHYEGTGLGLSIASNLVGLMGGTIKAASNIGEGSTFTIKFTIAHHADIAEPKRERANIIGANVLVIDDNSINRDILKSQIQHWKCRCIAVESAKLGLSVLKQAHDKNIKIDLIIVDFQMPGMNGEDFVRSMKSHPDYENIPTIMLSSVDHGELQKRMTDLGIAEFLTKPARSSILLNAVGNAIYKERAITKKAQSQTPAFQAATEQNGTTTNHVDVLIAEDNDVNQIYIKYIMEDLGLTYKIVPNGRAAIDKWKLLSPKVILMDISMPEMNGYEATQAIRKLEAKMQCKRTPIIAITAHTLKGDSERCLANDMDDYISKPLAINTLTQKLEKWGVLVSQPKSKKSI